MRYKIGPRALVYLTVVWLSILLILFATEYFAHLAVHRILAAEPSPLAEALIDALTITAVIAPITWWALVRPLREAIRLRTRFLGDVFAAIEDERRQTAYELHDGIGQQISLLISGLRSAHELLKNPEESARCRDLQMLAQDALAEVKRIARGLRPSMLDDFGLLAAIEKVVQDTREHATVEIIFQTAGLEGVRLPDPVETAVFRIVQEALANLIRHAGAGHATIDVRFQGGEITLTISDDGRGFDPVRAQGGSHLGLIGMRERVALLGGQFSLDTAPGRGCRIAVTLPTEGTIHE